MGAAPQTQERLLEEIDRLRREIAELEAGRGESDPTLAESARELRTANAFLRHLTATSVDAVIAADMGGRIIIFNGAASQVTGYSEKEARQSITLKNIFPGNDAEELINKLKDGGEGGQGQISSYRLLLRKDGTTVPVRLSMAMVHEGRTEVGVVGFFYDLREKRRMEHELMKTRVQLLQAEKMASVGRLAAGVAHQLNNPLCELALFAQLILEEHELEPEIKTDMNHITSAVERCREIVRELLQFARQTAKEMRPQDLNAAISRTISLLEEQPLFQNIDLVEELDSSLPSTPADMQQLDQVFLNILLNAADALEGEGRITVSSRLHSDGDRVLIEISDNGPGIPEAVLPHIFEPFFTTKEEGKGTGLGLSVAYGIIEDHHGKISAQSWPGEGATFTIELPLKAEPAEGAAVE